MRRFLIPALALAVAGGCGLAAGEDAQAVAEGNTAFALDLYGKLRAKEGNLVYSPYSASAALAMTAAGARGETEQEMVKVLHLPADRAQAQQGFGQLSKALAAAAGPGCRLEIANSLWGQKGVAWQADFQHLTKSVYGAGLREVDFADGETARKAINEWVEQQTQDKIKELFAAGTLSPDTVFALVDAVYFKGDWLHKFPKGMTKDGDFHPGQGAAVKVPMMRQTEKFRLYGDKQFQALEMPYQGNRLSMVVLLPREADGLAALEQALTPAHLEDWLDRLRNDVKVIVTLPRFKVTSSYDLIPPLKSLGMNRAFGGADFSGMASGERMALSAVVQKAFVEVNEEGTEAAAATGVVGARSAEPDRPAEFTADHPFLFLIRDNRTGTVLFMGRVTDPRG
jgi:serpin B